MKLQSPTSSIDQTPSNWFLSSQTTPPSSPSHSINQEKTITHHSPSSFQRLYRQQRIKLNQSTKTFSQAFDCDTGNEHDDQNEEEDHYLSSIANDTESNPTFGTTNPFKSNHTIIQHSPHSLKSQSISLDEEPAIPDSPAPCLRAASAPPFNKCPSFISLDYTDPSTPLAWNTNASARLHNPTAQPDSTSTSTLPSPHPLPESTVVVVPPWQTSLVKTPSRLQYSYTPSSPSNTTISEQHTFSFANSSAHSPALVGPDVSFSTLSFAKSSLHSPVVDPDGSFPSHSQHDHSLDSHAASQHHSPSPPPPPPIRSDYQSTFVDSPVLPRTTDGEARIVTNNDPRSLFINLNEGKSVSRIQDQTYSLLAKTTPNKSFGLQFTSPVSVGLNDWIIKPPTQEVSLQSSIEEFVDDSDFQQSSEENSRGLTGKKVIVNDQTTQQSSQPVLKRESELVDDHSTIHQSSHPTQRPPLSSEEPHFSTQRVLEHQDVPVEAPNDAYRPGSATQRPLQSQHSTQRVLADEDVPVEASDAHSPGSVTQRPLQSQQPAPRVFSREAATVEGGSTRRPPRASVGPDIDVFGSTSTSLAPLPVFSPFTVPSTSLNLHEPVSPLATRSQPKTTTIATAIGDGPAKLFDRILHSGSNETSDVSAGFIEIRLPKTGAGRLLHSIPTPIPAPLSKTSPSAPAYGRIGSICVPSRPTPVSSRLSHLFFNNSSSETSSETSVYYDPELSLNPGSEPQPEIVSGPNPPQVTHQQILHTPSAAPQTSVYYSPELSLAPVCADSSERAPDIDTEGHSSNPFTNDTIQASILDYNLERKSPHPLLISVLESLRQELSIKNEMVRVLAQDKATALSALSDLKQKVRELTVNERAQTNALEVSVGKLGAEISGRGVGLEVLESYREANIELERQNDKMNEELIKAKERIQELELGFGIKSKDINPDQELDNVRKELILLQTKYMKLEVKYNSQLRQRSKFQLEHDDRVRNLELNLVNQVEKFKNENEKLFKENINRKNIEGELKIENCNLREQINDFELKLNLENEKVNELENLKLENDRIMKENERLFKIESEYKNSNNQINEIGEDVLKLENKNKGLIEELDLIKNEYFNLKNSYNQIENENKALNNKINELKDLNESNESKEITKLKSKLSESINQSANREVKVTALKKIRNSLKEDIEGLNIALEAKQQEIAFLKRERQMFIISNKKGNNNRNPLNQITNRYQGKKNIKDEDEEIG
ncbi:hypothetical protein CROQUDRAFT_661413 [Cronartium quercuum f. sp. fusiforme G11]|uniref:Uncharacterized protein n=1 Tax=Cronartium quercuum f. sp. fusiforme G11 TaxID=708437 RepID=A0A9P6ND08_9BASI|nr:hypothetical protein CROQUDRAFT_661413 [Cronartium quercuum f. sp. fusiforme G11]